MIFTIDFYALTAALLLISCKKDRGKTRAALKKGWKSFENILPQILTVLMLIGIMLTLLSPETISLLLGKDSGWFGVASASVIGSVTLIPGFIAFLLGSLAAGPLYAAFPIAAVMLKKQSKFSNVIIFIGAWSTTKVPMLMFETASMGAKFTLLRFMLNLPVIILIAFITEKMLSKEEKAEVYGKAEKIN
jgi:uncharacterized membrane protein YraQ (UPF0718 family)